MCELRPTFENRYDFSARPLVACSSISEVETLLNTEDPRVLEPPKIDLERFLSMLRNDDHQNHPLGFRSSHG